jgi:hypothetical protein
MPAVRAIKRYKRRKPLNVTAGVEWGLVKPWADIKTTGDNGATEYGWRTEKPTKSKGKSVAEYKLLGKVNSNCRIYFPTKETVEASRGGVAVWLPVNPSFSYC